MSFWKSLIPDISVSTLVDMSHEELSLIDSFINSGDVDLGNRLLDNVLNTNHSTVALVMINSSVMVTTPKPVVPIRSSFYRRRRAITDLTESTQLFNSDAIVDMENVNDYVIILLLALLCTCQFIR